MQGFCSLNPTARCSEDRWAALGAAPWPWGGRERLQAFLLRLYWAPAVGLWVGLCCFGFHEAIDSTLFFSKSSVLHKSVGNPHPGPIELLSAFYLLFEFLFSPCVWKTEDLAQAGADARRRRQSQQPVALMLFLLVSFAERTELVVNVPRVRILLQLTTAVSA